MWRSMLGICGVLLALQIQACTSGASDTESTAAPGDSANAARAEVEAQTARVISAWNGDDPAAVAAFYATDAVITADSTYRGRDEVRDRWAAPALPVLEDLVISDAHIAASGDTFAGSGRYSYMLVLTDSAPIQVNGTFRNTWKRENGAWVIASEELTVDAPEAAR